ncbi:DUF368 domain-containing protein [Gilvimarinus sp. DA14]|uniref:DUF368 domain-containing protein n=1 Tax=Gilvimarinus sp. DA14 TaxID=2956798 RepID=UPI0020B6BF8B|nr:DUF368 domain-containing protein [Gilvimarinus sp. DA14]UTF60138.1 DUF368 domain-containing protein [Gilvimarinus sp. DA14]
MLLEVLKRYAPTFLKGMAMGAADVVPGVSGGTIAFITGIYERLLKALKSFTPQVLLILKREGLAAAWRHVDGSFLVALFGGVLFSIATLSHFIAQALSHYPLQVWGFFCGLIVASTVYLARSLDLLHPKTLIAVVLGILAAMAVAVLKPVAVPVNSLTVLGAGAVAICAMILPGVSGSFLLLVMGMYPVFVRAVTELDFKILVLFGSGCVLGLLLFSHVLYWLLQHWRRVTLGVLTGFLAGSLVIVWPWKQVLVERVNRHGETVPVVQENISPWLYEAATGVSPDLGSVSLCAALGFALVLVLEVVGRKRKDSI